MNGRDLAMAGAAVAALLLLARSARAAPVPPVTRRPGIDVRFPAPVDSSRVTLPEPIALDPIQSPIPAPPVAYIPPPAPAPAIMPQSPTVPVLSELQKAKNVEAFLLMLRFAEHDDDNVRSGRDFTTFYGGSTFTNLSDHPVLTGEKKGVPLPEKYCRAVGLSPGCVSTAAGALQINVPTWREFRAWGGPRLPDFSPLSQLEIGRRILRKIGAFDLIREGKFADAVFLARKRWASLPGADTGQPEKSVDYVFNAYQNAGGVLA